MYLEVAVLDGLHDELLHFGEAHEGDEGGQAGDVHAAVHLRQLAQHAQHRHLCATSVHVRKTPFSTVYYII